LGATPAFAWYSAQFWHYEREFLDSLFVQQLKRVSDDLDDHRGPFWYYLLEILKYSWPWLIFSVWGLRLARQEHLYSWAKLLLVWTGVYLLVVSVMATKLPWYILPIYPALALAAGYALAQVGNLPIDRPYNPIWSIILGIIGVVAGLLALMAYFPGNFVAIEPLHPLIILTLLSLSLTMVTTAILLARRSEQFSVVLLWGMLVSLFIFVNSPLWIWELNENFPVKPVASLVEKYVPADHPVYVAFAYERPSLNFYSGRRVFPLAAEELINHWQSHRQPYLIIDRQTKEATDLEGLKVIGSTDSGWFLVTKQ
jgi:4-amino-4-deoxy-L-arabinose transferase-like glycosyltransferase